jgi:rhodanese-related sulfurtransferase
MIGERADEPGAIAEVAPDEAVLLLTKGALLLDVREPQEWVVGHAPEASHIALGDLGERWREIPADHTVVVVCRSGHRSALATAALNEVGIKARNLTGGMLAWAAAGLAIVDESGGPGGVA